MAGIIDYIPEGETEHVIVPFKLVPYDVDNDGIPDFRETIDETDQDEDDNFVPDDFQGIRLGLQAPKHPESLAINNSRAMRLIKDQHLLEELLTDCNTCPGQTDLLNEWGYVGGNDGMPKETILTIRYRSDENSEHDAVPDDPERQEHLDYLRDYGYRFARCIDYTQIGNEIWSGAGAYEVVTACNGSAKQFSDIDGQCLPEAADIIFGWIAEQIDAVRDGAALAGRPMRIISPGAQMSTILIGKDGQLTGPENALETKAAIFINELINFSNEHCLYMDAHYHFQDYGQQFIVAADALIDEASPWDTVPNNLACLEWGPEPSHAWLTVNGGENVGFTEEFFDSIDGNEEEDSWQEWLDRWLVEDTAMVLDDSPGVTDFVFEGFLKLKNDGYQIGLWGPTHQTGVQTEARSFDLAALQPTKVTYPLPATAHWLGRFEIAAGDMEFDIDDFVPHPNPCVCADTCASVCTCP